MALDPQAPKRKQRESSNGASVKTEKTPHGRNRQNETDDDSDGEDAVQVTSNQSRGDQMSQSQSPDESEDDENPERSYQAQKRSRTNAHGDSVHTKGKGKRKAMNSEEVGTGDEPASQPYLPKRLILPRDADGYAPGSIVRVKLCNFLTYEGPAEFFPGARLNLLIGPNGTGKSSIACAIAIGLGFAPKTMGRANDLNDFVKKGAEKGYTEIELKGRKGEKNTVIRRDISAKNRMSTWTVNGKVSTARDALAKVQSYNIQADNLCAFIAQEKVSEFARMTPVQLLRQTEKAAGDSNLDEWHGQLIDLGMELEKQVKEIESDTAEYNQLEVRNNELARDVERWKEKQAIEHEVELYEIAVPALDYKASKENYDEAKTVQRKAAEHLQELKDRNEPMEKLKIKLEERSKELMDAREQQQARATKKYRELGAKQTDCEKMGQQSDELFQELEGLSKKEKQRKSKIAKLKEDIITLEEIIAQPPEVEDTEAIEAEFAKVQDEQDALKVDITAYRQTAKDHADETGRLRAEISACQRQLEDLSNVGKQRMDALHHLDKDTAEVVEWLRKNQNRFQKEVIEPACISLEVPNQAYVNHVESCINLTQLKTFVCQTQDDYRLLNRLVNDTPEVLGRKGRITTWFRVEDESKLPAPPLSIDMIQRLGFEGYAIDFVSANPGMLWFLKRECNMHRTAIARNGDNVNQAAAIKAIEAGGATGSSTFIAGQLVSRVTRSAYGKQLAQTSTEPLRRAQRLTGEAVDVNLREDLEGRGRAASEKLEEQQKGEEEIRNAEKEITARTVDIKKKHQAIQDRRAKRKRILEKHEYDKVKLEQKREQLAADEKVPTSDAEKAKIKKSLARVAEKRAHFMASVMALTEDVLSMQAASTHSAVRWLQANANVHALGKLSTSLNSGLTKAFALWEKAKDQFEDVKKESKEKLAIAKAKMNAASEELKERWNVLQETGITVETAREELETRKARLETIVIRDPDVIRQYEERRQKIESLGMSLKTKRHREQSLQKQIVKVRSKWYPALEHLVSSIGTKFSAAFDEIGCAGEIRLGEAESYDKWTIDIFVKFREDATLTQLTAFRQSGGERSLTTIMYLMSLTEFVRTPFSLVDEINQGMDSKAERVVHNQLVRVTCKQEAGQYFLVTPKLLQNLNYHPHMKILVVCNGYGLPDETRAHDLAGLLKSRVARISGSDRR